MKNFLLLLYVEESCENVSLLRIILFIKELLNIIFILIPICLIVMISVDLAKNVMANKDDDMRKNFQLAMKRVLFTVFLFLVPTIVNIAMNTIGQFETDYQKCLKVTKETIEQQSSTNSSVCNAEDNHTWDNTSQSCLITPKIPVLEFIIKDGKKITINDEEKKDNIVLINPSHQSNNETVSLYSKYNTEKKSMYILAERIETKLKDANYSVYITEKNDGTTGLDVSQVKAAIKKSKDYKDNVIYLALHSNAVDGKNKKTVGPEIYYKSGNEKSKNLADKLCKKIISVYNSNNLKPTNKGCLLGNSGTRVSEPTKYYSNNGKGAAVLIEIGYHDIKKNQEFIEKNGDVLAQEIVSGITDYILDNK